MSKPNQVLTARNGISAGTKCAVSLSTGAMARWSGIGDTSGIHQPAVACCGHTTKENLTQSEFVCQVCGYTESADVNGTRILAAGHAVQACGVRVQPGRPLKQEPSGT